MDRANNAQQKRTKTPSRSFLQSAPASVMKPRLMVILSAAALLMLGLVMVFSASSITGYVEQGSAISEAVKQVGYSAIGIVAIVLIFAFVSEERLRGRLGLAYWILCMGLILITAFMGTVGLGAKRWLVIGSISLQPSELAKIAIAIMTARIICDLNEGTIDTVGFAKRFVIYVLGPLAFILVAQSDLGTTMICLVAFIIAVWLGGASPRVIGVIIAIVVVLGIVTTVTTGYRSDRMSFLNPWADPDGTGYQLIHSFKAFAAGGLFGLGIGNSYEKLLYLPEAETDFIFSIIGEELGLVGALLVVALFLVFLRGGLHIARQASSDFGLVLVGSLSAMLVFQAYLNIACVLGLFPTTGKPLPFISSGGSSLVSSLLIVGIILMISFKSSKSKEIKNKRDNLRVVTSYSSPSIRNERDRSGQFGGRPLSTSGQSAMMRGAPRSRRSHNNQAGFGPDRLRDTTSRRR